jgi:hypothetical protein
LECVVFYHAAVLEIGRGMENPGGMTEGYERVGVRVQEVPPLAYPYPWGGYGGYPP